MRKTSTTASSIIIACLGAVPAAQVWAEPVLVNSLDKPGLHAPFSNNSDVQTWGKTTLVAGYAFDSYAGFSSASGNAILRYETTLGNGAPTVTPMSENEDWVFSLTMSHYGTEVNDFYFVGKANENTANEVRVFSLANTGNGGNFRLQLGPNNTLLADLGPMDSGTEGFHDIAIHYQAASQSFDAWFDGTRVANDVSNPMITDYGVDFFQGDDYVGSNDKYRQIRFGQAAPQFERPPGNYAKQWIQSHPFTIMGLTLRDIGTDIDTYTEGGMNNMLAWELGQTATLYDSEAAGLPWFRHMEAPDGDDGNFRIAVNNALVNWPNHGAGFLINDEPETLAEMQATGQAIAWLKENHGEFLSFSNVGGAPDYESHVDQFIANAQPDLLMFDHYPFSPGGTEPSPDLITFRQRMAIIREKALANDLPYWAFLQTYENTDFPLTNLSESDIRMQVYQTLAHGFTGIAYFTYDGWDPPVHGIVSAEGTPTEFYPWVQSINAEVVKVGKVLRLLESTEVGYVSTEPLPSGLPQWDAGDGPYLSDVTATNLGSTNGGAAGDVVVGYFVPDGEVGTDNVHFMVTNLLRSHTASADQAEQEIRLDFDFGASGIDGLLRLSRITGEPERVTLIHDGGALYHVDLILDGGTGDLFRFDNGDFAGIPGGDTDLDGDVDLSDLGTLATYYGTGAGARWGWGDFDLDGDVDLSDLGELATNYGLGAAQAFADFQTLVSAPEPAGLAILVFPVLISHLTRAKRRE